MTAEGGVVEIRGTAEKASFSRTQLDVLAALAAQDLVKAQPAALGKEI